MSVFDLHAQVLADYRDFVGSFFTVADERARQFVEHALVEKARLWPDFLLQVSPAYERSVTVEDLARRGAAVSGLRRTPTYRGRQGADRAMLIRRVEERCAAPSLVHVGTSATMVASLDATPESRRACVRS